MDIFLSEPIFKECSMPLYNLVSNMPLSETCRERVAQAITDTHCRVTGAPGGFVNVVFLHGYRLRRDEVINVMGGVRKGGNRTAAVIENLRTSLRDAIAHTAELRSEQVAVSLLGLAANWVVEGGRVMPEPGTEAEWLKQKSRQDQNLHAPDSKGTRLPAMPEMAALP
jgi:hypothetical protein